MICTEELHCVPTQLVIPTQYRGYFVELCDAIQRSSDEEPG